MAERVIKTAGIVMVMALSKTRVLIMRIKTGPLVHNQWRDVSLRHARFVVDGDAKRKLDFYTFFDLN